MVWIPAPSFRNWSKLLNVTRPLMSIPMKPCLLSGTLWVDWYTGVVRPSEWELKPVVDHHSLTTSVLHRFTSFPNMDGWSATDTNMTWRWKAHTIPRWLLPINLCLFMIKHDWVLHWVEPRVSMDMIMMKKKCKGSSLHMDPLQNQWPLQSRSSTVSPI